MSNRFEVPDDDSSPPPSTPDRSRYGSGLFHFAGNHPSTTPAGPPPSSTASFTPAGAPSESYLGSSIMRGVTAQKPASFSSRISGTASKNSSNLFAPKSNSPLGRSIQASSQPRHQPSRLSRQFFVSEDEEDEEDEEAQGGAETGNAGAGVGPKPFDVQYGEEDHDTNEDDEGDTDEVVDDTQADLWMHMADNAGPADRRMPGDESDLMMFTTPAATERINERIRKEAEDIFRASAMRSIGRPPRECRFAAIAKSLYTQMGCAEITEAPQLILETEALISRLYDVGVGPREDEELLDRTLAQTSGSLVTLWQAYVESLPSSDVEHAAGIGPGPHASAFENAAYLGSLALQVHHTRSSDNSDMDGLDGMEPLTETLFRWLSENHNLYPGQVQEVQKFKPSPACHNMFWQTVFICLLQGRVPDALSLLSAGGWEHVRRGASPQPAYTGRALINVQRAVQETIDMLENCPGRYNNWQIWNNDWTIFRIRAKGALDQLRRFAEGRNAGSADPEFADSYRGGRNSLSSLARKAESQVPWDIYENLNIIFDIALGARERILAISQDWCEAAVGLFGWWDEGRDDKGAGGSQLSMSRSQSLMLASRQTNSESYVDRLARAFRATLDSGLEINSNNPLEVGMACVFEDNPKGIVGILRGWSLPVACAVAEIASLGGWLPPHQSPANYGIEELDTDDLEVLGVDPTDPDDIEGIKDNTLIQYALRLANDHDLGAFEDSTGKRTEGWELAIHVLGRMESSERSEDAVGDLVRTVLQTLDVDSGGTVDKVWRLLSGLGMAAFAEEAAEHYGELLAQESHRYGEAVWYYALAHRPAKVREVMNLLISYSLVQSAAYPAEHDLDEHLHQLLNERSATLEGLARQDLEAAELLGRMMSGYATLRKFYEIRDDETVPLPRRRAAAASVLTAVIASADDNIRGGLYDGTRDAVVSEDFILALLGEATMFLSNKDKDNKPVAVSLDTIDVLLKTVEDVQTVGARVYDTCDEFFQLVLQSAPGGLKGSKPADLLRKSTGGGLGGSSSSYVMSGSSMLASQLHRSIMAVGGSGGSVSPSEGGGKGPARRGWDWRASLSASTTAEDVLRRLRLGLSRDLARLWIAEADGGGSGGGW